MPVTATVIAAAIAYGAKALSTLRSRPVETTAVVRPNTQIPTATRCTARTAVASVGLAVDAAWPDAATATMAPTARSVVATRVQRRVVNVRTVPAAAVLSAARRQCPEPLDSSTPPRSRRAPLATTA